MAVEKLGIEDSYLVDEKRVPRTIVRDDAEVSSEVDRAGGWTAPEIMRLGAVAGDLAALLDPEPFSTAVLSYGSDLVNLGADVAEGRGLLPTLGSFASNALLSTVAVIPGIGQAIGSTSKVIKAVTKLAPKVMHTVLAAGAIGMLSNANEICASIKKIDSKDPNDVMDATDWRNILSGIQFVLGGALAIRNSKVFRGSSGKNIDNIRNTKTDKESVLNYRTKTSYEIKSVAGERQRSKLGEKLFNETVDDGDKLILRKFLDGRTLKTSECKHLIDHYGYDELSKIELEANPNAILSGIKVNKDGKYCGELFVDHLETNLRLIKVQNDKLLGFDSGNLVDGYPYSISVLPFDKNGKLYPKGLRAFTTMRKGKPAVISVLDGKEITPEEFERRMVHEITHAGRHNFMDGKYSELEEKFINEALPDYSEMGKVRKKNSKSKWKAMLMDEAFSLGEKEAMLADLRFELKNKHGIDIAGNPDKVPNLIEIEVIPNDAGYILSSPAYDQGFLGDYPFKRLALRNGDFHLAVRSIFDKNPSFNADVHREALVHEILDSYEMFKGDKTNERELKDYFEKFTKSKNAKLARGIALVGKNGMEIVPLVIN